MSKKVLYPYEIAQVQNGDCRIKPVFAVLYPYKIAQVQNFDSSKKSAFVVLYPYKIAQVQNPRMDIPYIKFWINTISQVF